MFKKPSFLKIFILCLFTIPTTYADFPASSTIYNISSMNEVEQYVDKEALVLFDLDHTIFEGKKYGYGHANWYYDQIEKGKAKGVDEKTTIAKMYSHWIHSQKNTEVKPVEAVTPELIRKLQKQGVMVVGLTSRQVPIADITLKQLQDIDVNFKLSAFPDAKINQKFTAATLMKGGVIFCSDYNDKGAVLHAYLDSAKIYPKKILFVDDRVKNIKSVTDAYAQQAVVVGLHYPLVDEQKAKKQWDAHLAHQEYYEEYLKNADLHDFPLEG